jgi:polysaccharide export outer membrane protein
MKNRLIIIIGALFIVVVSFEGCSTTHLSQKKAFIMAKADSSYKIRQGDGIRIEVLQHADFDTTDTVSSRGYIIAPHIGKLKAAGKTRPELKQNLKQKLTKYIKGKINLVVSVKRRKWGQVSIFGSVKKSDVYQIPGAVSIFTMLSIAGGPTDNANIKKVRVYHRNGNHEYYVLNVPRYIKKGKVEEAPKVYPGDIVYVPKKVPVIKYILHFFRAGLIAYVIREIVD